MARVVVLDLDPGDALVFRTDVELDVEDVGTVSEKLEKLLGVRIVMISGEFDIGKLSARRIGAIKELFNDQSFRTFMRDISRLAPKPPDWASESIFKSRADAGDASTVDEPVISPAVDEALRAEKVGRWPKNGVEPAVSVTTCAMPVKIKGVMAPRTCEQTVDKFGDCPTHGHDVPTETKVARHIKGKYECAVVNDGIKCGRWLINDNVCPSHGSDAPADYVPGRLTR